MSLREKSLGCKVGQWTLTKGFTMRLFLLLLAFLLPLSGCSDSPVCPTSPAKPHTFSVEVISFYQWTLTINSSVDGVITETTRERGRFSKVFTLTPDDADYLVVIFQSDIVNRGFVTVDADTVAACSEYTTTTRFKLHPNGEVELYCWEYN